MAQVVEDTRGKIRDLPIDPRLRAILKSAAEAAGIDTVRVTSGGQAKRGTPGKRTGSTRHDLGNAADLMLIRAGETLSFTDADDLPLFEQFVAAAAAKGATGIGAGVDYMGPRTIHVGFGSEAVWGAGGKAATAPPWLKRAVQRGRAARDGQSPLAAPQPPAQSARGDFVVIARSGLRLRAGPGPEFASQSVLPRGTRLSAVMDQAHAGWARVDLQGDGLFDGYVFAAYIARS
ncbi:MAG TPA: SH3 domain-containing protein [Allosphingosinicella sp.]|nr:SH3 domain-containing protein [Allosphingosinicella sp.]